MKNLLVILALFSFVQCKDELPTNYLDIQTTTGNYHFTPIPDLPNSYYLRDNQDEIWIVGQGENNFSFGLFLNGTKMNDQIFPFEIPRNVDFGFGVFQLLNGNNQPDTLFGDNDSVNYVGTTTEDLKIKILSFRNGILRGTLQGPITTRTGKQETILGGTFEFYLRTVSSY